METKREVCHTRFWIWAGLRYTAAEMGFRWLLVVKIDRLLRVSWATLLPFCLKSRAILKKVQGIKIVGAHIHYALPAITDKTTSNPRYHHRPQTSPISFAH